MLSKRNKQILASPIIGRVIALNNYMITHAGRAYKLVQHNYIDGMLKDGRLLFLYARRQLLGLDYLKRCVEICEEIEAQAYFIHAIGGWPLEVAGDVNVWTEQIVSMAEAVGNSRNHKPIR